jgi:hypothetical protein
MSKYGWERGEIKFSVKEFVSFRRSMIQFYNERQVRLFDRAKFIHSQLVTAGKGKRGFDFYAMFEKLVVGNGYGEAYDANGYEELSNVLFPFEKVEGKGYIRVSRPKAPKKNQFAPLKQNANGIPVGHEAGISFNRVTRVVTWSVSENNHSVERAHDHETGRAFFKRLSVVNWTRGTGGEIVGNDEYNQESQESGRGGNYTTNRYGVAEKQFKQSFAAARSWR